MKRLPLFALIAAGVITLPAVAQFKKPEDAKVMNKNIELVNTLNLLQFSAFLDGTDKGAKTHAKPEIWSQKHKFNAAVEHSQDAVAQLVAAGKSGDLAQIKSAVGTVGKSCKACHDDFSTM